MSLILPVKPQKLVGLVKLCLAYFITVVMGVISMKRNSTFVLKRAAEHMH